ncbi:MAG: GtrA family protein [Patescibacteria group bacterium]|nr:GtrA family protein [Patescibacteria group bacterium]MBU2509097.1 GtrA family protein [Patescibacteria group bacterium]
MECIKEKPVQGRINKLISLFRREFWTIFRFGFVGSSSLLVKIGFYALMSRFLWVDGLRTLQNIIALSLAMIYNYTFHRFWTFKQQNPAPGSGKRYVIVIIIANVMDAVFFYIGYEWLNIYDFYLLIGIAFIIAAFTFLAHRLYTFHNNPMKHILRNNGVSKAVEENLITHNP